VTAEAGETAQEEPMAQTVFESLDDVRAAVGTTLGTSDWIEITQQMVDRFADATGDHQWIHVDVERATKESPYGGPIAHGYLTLSLSNLVMPQVVEVRGASLGVNYGTGRVRFPAPVPVGSRVRGTAELVACDEIPRGIQTTIVVTIEVEGGTKPACVVESLSRWLA
jgi:acyl dehydratase